MAKRDNVVFTETSLFTSVDENQGLLENFIEPDEVSLMEYDMRLYGDLDKAVIVAVPLKRGHMYLELLEVPDSFYNYNVVTSGGQTLPSSRYIKHYRGVVKGQLNSIVAISFSDNEVMGVIATDEGNFNLGLDTKYGKHVFYNEKNLKHKMNFECGSISGRPTDYDTSVLFEKTKTAILSSDVCTRLYLETEYDIFQARGGVGAVENFVTAVFNQVATLYQNENIETRLSEIFVWTSPDPYTETDLGDLLEQFQDYRTSFSGDLGQLLSFRSAVSGLAAGFDGLCNPSVRERLSVSMIQNSFNAVPVFSLTVFVIAHEFGHLFGSRHTHACVWNGNNTAIDGCGTCMENPDPTILNCNNCPRPPIPSGGGTIMSYCSNTSVGVSFTLGFGPQPGNVIRNSVANADCLCACFNGVITGPDVLCSSEIYTVTNLPIGATVTGWSALPAGAVSFSGSGNSRAVTRSGSYSGHVTLTVMISTACGVETVHKGLASGTVTDHFIDGPTHVNVGWSSIYFAENTFLPGQNITSRDWFFAVPPPVYSLTPISGGIAAEVIIGTPGIYVLALSVTNPCGASEAAILGIEVEGSGGIGGFFSVHLDTQDESITVSMPEEPVTSESDKSDPLPYVAVLYDDAGTEVRKAEHRDGTIRFDTQDLPDGTYRVQINQGDKLESHEVVIRH